MLQLDQVRYRIDLPESSHTHTAENKRRKSILCLIYIHTHPTHARPDHQLLLTDA